MRVSQAAFLLSCFLVIFGGGACQTSNYFQTAAQKNEKNPSGEKSSEKLSEDVQTRSFKRKAQELYFVEPSESDPKDRVLLPLPVRPRLVQGHFYFATDSGIYSAPFKNTSEIQILKRPGMRSFCLTEDGRGLFYFQKEDSRSESVRLIEESLGPLVSTKILLTKIFSDGLDLECDPAGDFVVFSAKDPGKNSVDYDLFLFHLKKNQLLRLTSLKTHERFPSLSRNREIMWRTHAGSQPPVRLRKGRLEWKAGELEIVGAQDFYESQKDFLLSPSRSQSGEEVIFSRPRSDKRTLELFVWKKGCLQSLEEESEMILLAHFQYDDSLLWLERQGERRSIFYLPPKEIPLMCQKGQDK